MVFAAALFPVLYALFLWWFSTGLIIYLDGLQHRTYRWTMGGATLLGVAALFGLAASADDPSAAGAVLAFTCALLVWGWNETAFLMGYLTGPRREPAAEGSTLGRRFRQALGAILWHELALLASLGVVAVLTFGQPNEVGLGTFAVLWVMRLSAKLNLFLGVPNLAIELLPHHLRYLESFLARRPLNALFPLSITGGTVWGALLVAEITTVEAGGFEAIGLTLIATMLTLALLEHWLMVLPLSETALWAWAMGSRNSGRDVTPETASRSPCVTISEALPVFGGLGGGIAAPRPQGGHS